MINFEIQIVERQINERRKFVIFITSMFDK